MRSVARSLAAGVEGLDADLALADVLLDALEQRYRPDHVALRQFVARARRQTYANTIISCYGLIEHIVDQLLMSVAETYNSFVPTFGDIPISVRASHRSLILQCLRDDNRARTRRPVNEQDAIKALGLGDASTPALVPEVCTLSTANYRFPYVCSLFSRIGVDVENGLYHGRVDDALAKTGFANYESFLEDLVQRRNDLAHSLGDVDIVDRQLLGAYVEVVQGWLLDLIRQANLFAIRVIRDWKLEPIAVVDKQWTRIVGISLEVSSICIGDQILLFKREWCTSHKVESMQSMGVDAEDFSFAGQVLHVGLMVDQVPAGAEGCEVFVLPDDLSEYWPGSHKWENDTLI